MEATAVNKSSCRDHCEKLVLYQASNEMGDLTTVGEIGKELEKEAPFPLTDTDKWVLSQNDEDFHLHTWDELREIIGKEGFWLPTCTFFFST
jgi:hypothetical protein